jgi:hypothetical protein
MMDNALQPRRTTRPDPSTPIHRESSFHRR